MIEHEVSQFDSFKITWNGKILMKMTFRDLLLIHVYQRQYITDDVKCFIDSIPDPTEEQEL